MKKNIFVACDFSSQNEAVNLIEQIKNHIFGIKVGLQYVTSTGIDGVKALTKFNLPQVKVTSKKNKNWKFLCNYKNSISNKKLNINLYYKFSSKIPSEYNWYSLNKNNEFIPTFTKKIFKQISHLY